MSSVLRIQSAHERFVGGALPLLMSMRRDRMDTGTLLLTTGNTAKARLFLLMETIAKVLIPCHTHNRVLLIIKKAPIQERLRPRTTVLTCSTLIPERIAQKMSM